MTSAYKAQSFGSTLTSTNTEVWKAWVPPKNPIFLLGCLFKIGFERQIVWRREVGTIVDFVPFARNRKKWRHILFARCRYTKRLLGWSRNGASEH
jgi:hypothetical protein